MNIKRFVRQYHLLLILFCLSYLLPKTALAQEQGNFTISGYIDDASSRETLIGATIYSHEYKTGAYTNAFGFYSLTLPKGTKTVRISYVGYKPQVIKLDGKDNDKLNIHLELIGTLQELIVTAEKRELSTPNIGSLNVPVQIIKTAPSLMGESDLMKTLQLLPGVQSGSEGSSGVFVRGGGPDENLILLDGVPLYNVDHMMGFFSVFTPEAVKNVKLYKGSFPARFGGRLSSVIDVRTNDGNLKDYHGTVSVGLISSKLQFEGPIVKDKTSFNLSMRRTYADLIATPFMPKGEKASYYFYDTNLKLQQRLGGKDRLFLSFYHGLDKFYGEDKRHGDRTERIRESEGRIKWGNTLAALRWNHTFSPKLYSDLTFAYTHYHFLFGTNSSEESVKTHKKRSIDTNYKSGLHDYSAKWNLNYYLNSKYKFRFGVDYLFHNFRPEAFTIDKLGIDDEELEKENLENLDLPKFSTIYAHNTSVYLESQSQFTKELMLNLGLRASDFYVEGKHYLAIQPRAILEYRPIHDLQFQLSYSKMNQNVHLLTSANMTLPSDLWVPTTKLIKPMDAQQISFGTVFKGWHGWELSLEAYYKDMRNILEYKDGASFMGFSSGWEDKVAMGQGRAYGLELLLMRTLGRTTGWLGYTLAKSERRFNDESLNNGHWFPYKYDRRHQFNFVISHKFSKRIDASASWEFHSGGYITIPTGKIYDLTHDVENLTHWNGRYRQGNISESRNNFHVPPTHKLNLSVNFNRFHKNGAKSIWNVSIYNVYNAMNPSFIYADNYYVTGNSFELTKFTLLPIIPSVSYTYKF